jgi:hypothetical protein
MARGLAMLIPAGVLAVQSLRHIGVFFVTLPFALAAAGAGAAAGRGGAASVWAPAWGIAAALVFVLHPDPAAGPVGIGVAEGRFPVTETDWLERSLAPPRRLYNDVAHGGYLIWRLHPGDEVFVDGRNEVHEDLIAETAAAISDGRAWQAFLDRHGIEAALVRYRTDRIRIAGDPGGEPRGFAALHFPRGRWALVHWGDAAMIFLRRGGRHQSVIERGEYRLLDPEDPAPLIRRLRAGDTELKRLLLEEVGRMRSEGLPAERLAGLVAALGGGGEV